MKYSPLTNNKNRAATVGRPRLEIDYKNFTYMLNIQIKCRIFAAFSKGNIS